MNVFEIYIELCSDRVFVTDGLVYRRLGRTQFRSWPMDKLNWGDGYRRLPDTVLALLGEVGKV